MQELLLIIGIVATVLTAWGMWRMFEKAGESGWKALLPVYNIYVILRVSDYSRWWALGLLLIYPLKAVQQVLRQAFCPGPYYVRGCDGWLSELMSSYDKLFAFDANMAVAALILPLTWVLLFAIITTIYVHIHYYVAKKFGRGVWFAAGLAFLPFIFWPILGLGDAEYQEGGQ